MKIILGQELDGSVFRDFENGSAEAGVMTAGTAGFLDFLEQALGLPLKKKSLLRVFRYERALADSLNDSAFYAASFRIDPYSAADILLKSRDEILLSAPSTFDFSRFSPEHGRLHTFAGVEKRFLALNPEPGVPDRLRAVIRELKAGRTNVRIDDIVLVDGRPSWHVLFRELLAILERRGTKISPYVPSFPEAAGDLASVRRHLTDGTIPAVPVKEDGSFLLVRGPGVTETAWFLSTLVSPLLEAGERVLLIGKEGTDILRETFVECGLPAPDGEAERYGRPLLQMLPLLLSLRFDPTSLEDLVRYLSLPCLPVPPDLKRDLLGALASAPGIDGSRWRLAMDKIRTGSGNAFRDGATRTAERWLTFRTVPENGTLPIAEIEELCGLFSEFLRARTKRSAAGDGDGEEDSEIEAGFLQIELVLNVLALRSVREIGRSDLAAVFRDIARQFAVQEKSGAEAGSVWSVQSPDAVLGRADTVVFWNFSESAIPVPARLIFSPGERSLLSGSGVEFLTPGSLYSSHEQAVVRAVSSASKRVYLVCPEQGDGRPVNPHPLWYRMIGAFRAKDEGDKKLCLGSSAWLSSGSLPVLSGKRSYRECGGTIVFDRRSTLPDALPSVTRLSPSSLGTFLGCPLSYVLTHCARMRPTFTELPESNRLYGTIAHDVIEACLGEDREFRDTSRIGDRLRKAAETFIARSAAVLLEEGMDRERAYVVRKIVEGGSSLVRALERGGYAVASIEERLLAELDSTDIEGFPDLVVERRSTGRKAVIDLKWAGEENFRKLLENGTNVQTAAYSFLLGSVPAAYFIITSGRFLTVHPDLFPGTDAVNGPPEDEVWASAADAIRVRRRALAENVVEVGPTERDWKAARAEGRAGFFSPAPCRFCDHRTYCGSEEA